MLERGGWASIPAEDRTLVLEILKELLNE